MHRHRMAGKVYRRLSDLVFADGRPLALLRWIDLGGVRTPLCVCELDPAQLEKISYNVYRYAGVTEDPRFRPAGTAGERGLFPSLHRHTNDP